MGAGFPDKRGRSRKRWMAEEEEERDGGETFSFEALREAWGDTDRVRGPRDLLGSSCEPHFLQTINLQPNMGQCHALTFGRIA